VKRVLTDGGDPHRLTFESVSHQFGEVTVLEDISLQVEPGNLVAIVGPNGSGKTTLLRIATGLLTPSSGTVDRPEDGQRPIGYLPQHPTLRSPMTVQETLDFYRALLDGSDSLDDVLEVTGLEDVPDRRVDALSGGMRQLLGLGLAMLSDPPLVVLDEPTGSLDPRNTEHIFRLISELTTEVTGTLLTTHKLEYLYDADRILVLDDSQMIVRASPEELLDRTTEDSLIGAFNSILGTGPAVQTGQEEN